MKATSSITIDIDLMQEIKARKLNLSNLVNEFLFNKFKEPEALKASEEDLIKHHQSILKDLEKQESQKHEEKARQIALEAEQKQEQLIMKEQEREQRLSAHIDKIKEHPDYHSFYDGSLTSFSFMNILFADGIFTNAIELLEILKNK